MEKMVLFGNEAIARGAWEAGATVGTGYPGTPSTEILESFVTYPEVSTEWSVNEKVALEVGLGAAMTGARTLVTMKHVGVNVASDPLFTSAYTGIKGGMVIVTADDPELHSSQNEQDNRNYARAAKLPMLEPGDSQEAKDFTKMAFSISEQFDTPVFLRSTTRISHSQTIVNVEDRVTEGLPEVKFVKNLKKFVMIPAFARARHHVVEERLLKIAEYAETLEINRIEEGDTKRGFITSGIVYNYVKEAFPDAAVLKLGMVHPLPEKLIRKFCEQVDEVFIVEELDPFFELQIKAMGIEVKGKACFPITGELSPDLITQGVTGEKPGKPDIAIEVPPRPPALCPGCPHRTVFTLLHDMDMIVTGDIGCYTLGVLPPFSAIDTCVDMGASITVSQGIEMAMGKDFKNDTVAVIGDSTFAHSGITGLLNAAYNKRTSLIIVLDNGTTAMTGMQPNPLSGEMISGESTVALDYVKLGEAVGMSTNDIKMVNAFKKEEVEEAMKEMIAAQRLSLLVIKGPCILDKKHKKKKNQ